MENKDYLNQRFFRKRVLYLTFVAAHLQKYEIVSSAEFMHHNGNHMKPILVVTPAGECCAWKGKYCQFQARDLDRLIACFVLSLCKGSVWPGTSNVGRTLLRLV